MQRFFFVLFFITACATKPPQGEIGRAVNSQQQEVRIAVVNLLVKGGANLEQHLQRINEFARQSTEQKAEFLLLPELTIFDLLPPNPGDKEITSEMDRLSSLAEDYQKGLSNIAQKHRINIVGASAVVKKDSDYFNRAFYIDTKGSVHHQNKIYPTPWEVTYGFKGGDGVNVFTHEKFSFAILICHDAEFPNVSANLAKPRPEVIFVPSMTDDLHGLNRVRITSAARAVEHMSYVFMTGTAGAPGAHWHTYVGQNFFFTPQNKFFPSNESTGALYSEGLSVYKIDIGLLRKARSDAKQIYPARDLLRQNLR